MDEKPDYILSKFSKTDSFLNQKRTKLCYEKTTPSQKHPRKQIHSEVDSSPVLNNDFNKLNDKKENLDSESTEESTKSSTKLSQIGNNHSETSKKFFKLKKNSLITNIVSFLSFTEIRVVQKLFISSPIALKYSTLALKNSLEKLSLNIESTTSLYFNPTLKNNSKLIHYKKNSNDKDSQLFFYNQDEYLNVDFTKNKVSSYRKHYNLIKYIYRKAFIFLEKLGILAFIQDKKIRFVFLLNNQIFSTSQCEKEVLMMNCSKKEHYSLNISSINKFYNFNNFNDGNNLIISFADKVSFFSILSDPMKENKLTNFISLIFSVNTSISDIIWDDFNYNFFAFSDENKIIKVNFDVKEIENNNNVNLIDFNKSILVKSRSNVNSISNLNLNFNTNSIVNFNLNDGLVEDNTITSASNSKKSLLQFETSTSGSLLNLRFKNYSSVESKLNLPSPKFVNLNNNQLMLTCIETGSIVIYDKSNLELSSKFIINHENIKQQFKVLNSNIIFSMDYSGNCVLTDFREKNYKRINLNLSFLNINPFVANFPLISKYKINEKLIKTIAKIYNSSYISDIPQVYKKIYSYITDLTNENAINKHKLENLFSTKFKKLIEISNELVEKEVDKIEVKYKNGILFIFNKLNPTYMLIYYLQPKLNLESYYRYIKLEGFYNENNLYLGNTFSKHDSSMELSNLNSNESSKSSMISSNSSTKSSEIKSDSESDVNLFLLSEIAYFDTSKKQLNYNSRVSSTLEYYHSTGLACLGSIGQDKKISNFMFSE